MPGRLVRCDSGTNIVVRFEQTGGVYGLTSHAAGTGCLPCRDYPVREKNVEEINFRVRFIPNGIIWR